MSAFVHTDLKHKTGIITLDRPKALNSLSLDMIRAIATALHDWRDDDKVDAVVIRSSSERALCAGGDIRFFYDAGRGSPQGGSALLEDFFTEEYALNHLIHFYPKPYVAVMDGIVMGGGMGVAQGGESNRMRIVTDRTKMAMPEVNIGLFPDVGGGYFLSRAPGELGTYLGVTGETIGAADALYAGLADVFVPAAELPALWDMIEARHAGDIREAILRFAEPFKDQADPASSALANWHSMIDKHFAYDDVPSIVDALTSDGSAFAQATLSTINKRSPLMMSVTLSQLRRSASMGVADCLRMERTMVRHSFEQSEVIEGIRSVVIDKDGAPKWVPSSLADVTPEMVERYFEPAWPSYAHPLRALA
ncbi:enoyl-CoA hydratase/isomerase family protein [Noviherbaspirillum sp.]|jgi:enoyl-CoA hydratase/carnithine racemase|uniref:enoyl-CoA hydratase/isomerase family protein n=1 Tax=Noviherbaspirillum sp. TaxID=1926288 RepID=UPI0025DFE94A|nr:enoyl-CoA hydratase/isomerase family protein [Noviherbaspirillum sp.]